MLHLVFQSPPDIAVLDRMADGDTAVFMESAVLNMLHQGRLAALLTAKTNSNHLYVLSEDMVARGIDESELAFGLEVIDYAGLVKLTVDNSLIASWC